MVSIEEAPDPFSFKMFWHWTLWQYLSTAQLGDNMLDSIHPSVHLSGLSCLKHKSSTLRKKIWSIYLMGIQIGCAFSARSFLNRLTLLHLTRNCYQEETDFRGGVIWIAWVIWARTGHKIGSFLPTSRYYFGLKAMDKRRGFWGGGCMMTKMATSRN